MFAQELVAVNSHRFQSHLSVLVVIINSSHVRVNSLLLFLLHTHILVVHASMLAYQSSTLGLFPRGKSHHARIRDNVYCANALWCLSLAYRYTCLAL